MSGTVAKPSPVDTRPVRVGDEIRIASSGHSAGAPDRRGVIVDLAGEHFLVRWQDGRESVLHRDLVAPRR